MRCYGIVGNERWRQEWYETASRDAPRRAKELRALGFRVSVIAMGCQLAGVGKVGLSLVNIRPGEGQTELGGLPKVEVFSL
jgi:hypothetical protein